MCWSSLPLRRAALAALAVAFAAGAAAHDGGWRQSSRESANLAPAPAAEPAAVIQAYAAPVWGWRGLFADHTWVAYKPANAAAYTVMEVIGWRLRGGGKTAVRIAQDTPDRHWFGGKPRLLADLRGAAAERLIPRLRAAAQSYPFAGQYRMFPGPNSNTFTAWLAKQTPELNLRLPLRAVGKSYIHFAPAAKARQAPNG